MTYRLGVDTGGTFTDFVLLDETTGRVVNLKVPSTPRDPAQALVAGARSLLGDRPEAAPVLSAIFHGTTVATNALLERKGAATGLLTTAGFRDVLEIRRHVRPQGRIYDLDFAPPEPLVRRPLRLEVTERMDARGRVLVPLDEDEALARARELLARGATAIAVVFLHAHVNPAHELAVKRRLARELPGCFVCVSSEISPEIREYERTSTTVVNASLGPVVSHYVTALEARLADAGVRAPVRIMQGNGGVLPAERAARRPVQLVASGPAAGVVGGTLIGRRAGFPDVITMDMGGTSCDLCLVEGTPRMASQKEVDGNPIRVPMFDLHVIGAGGGSIAWLDSSWGVARRSPHTPRSSWGVNTRPSHAAGVGGALRVGPRSAGADPGPAAYGRGGLEPTVTDANVALGRLDPDYFLGGAMKLDVGAARAALEDRVARPLGLTVEAAAAGILRVVNANMAESIKVVSVKQGHDPRDFALVAFGGAGPTHATALLGELQAKAVLVPSVPGTLSALGLLATDLRHDYVVARLGRLEAMRADEVGAALAELVRRGAAELADEGVAPEHMRFELGADVRYVGQAYEVAVPVATVGAASTFTLDVAAVASAFHAEHERLYAHSLPESIVELVALRVTAFGTLARPAPESVEAGGTEPSPSARKATRPVYFEEAGGWVDCPIWDRAALRAGNRLRGPAIIEQMDTTTVLLSGQTADVHETGTLVVRVTRG